MAKRAHQKLKLLALKQLLEQQTDERHTMTAAEMIAGLSRWGITAERKSIYDDLEALREFGMDIQCHKGKQGGWFLGERVFELPELKLLVDAVQASKFITRRKSSALIRKLETLTSVHDAKQLQRQVYVDRRVKTMNESIYYIVDRLHDALSANRAVTFHYWYQDRGKQRVFRRGGALYCVSPCGLIWENENYYLVGWDRDKDELRHYRVDKMADLTVTPLPRFGRQDIDVPAYAAKHFGMFHGEERTLTLRCANQLSGVVLDRFGQDIILVPDGEDHFTVTLSLVVSPQFWGWLFGLGKDAAVASPAWAVEEYRIQLEAALAALPPRHAAP